jgi:hypothetical protein
LFIITEEKVKSKKVKVTAEAVILMEAKDLILLRVMNPFRLTCRSSIRSSRPAAAGLRMTLI